MKLRFGKKDWAGLVSLLAVLVVGAMFLVGAPSLIEAAGTSDSTSDDEPAASPSPEPTTPQPSPSGDPTPGKGPKQDGKSDAKFTVKRVPDSGSDMEIVLPGGNWAPESTTPVEFVVSSFNVLGDSHTGPNGRRKGFTIGPTRARWAAQLIAAQDVGIIGLQELEAPQARVMMRALPGYGIYPGPSKRRHKSANSIMWRTAEWEAVQTTTIGIPYFKGNVTQMPYLRLRHRETGTDLWVANFHNPASTKRRGDNSRWRAEATRRQIALANHLRKETGLPVIFTGDFNERKTYFCRLVAGTDLEASNGGTADGGRCSPPGDLGIDWIFGTPEIEWLSSARQRSALISRISDHPMVVATGRLSVVDQDAVEEALDGLSRIEGSTGDDG